MTSRTGEKHFNINSPHINTQLKPFFDMYPTAVLDGELFNDNLKEKLCVFSEIVAIKTQDRMTPEMIKRSDEVVEFHCYDGYDPSSKDTEEDVRWRHRFPLMAALLMEGAFEDELPKNIKIEGYWDCDTMEEVEQHFEEYTSEGGEGLILRLNDLTYQHKRSKYLVKKKPTDDAEFLVTGIEEGSGDWAGKARKIFLVSDDKCNDDRIAQGTEFKADFAGKMEGAKSLLNIKDSFIGKHVKIFYNGVTGKNVPNFAKFREFDH